MPCQRALSTHHSPAHWPKENKPKLLPGRLRAPYRRQARPGAFTLLIGPLNQWLLPVWWAGQVLNTTSQGWSWRDPSLLTHPVWAPCARLSHGPIPLASSFGNHFPNKPLVFTSSFQGLY